MKDSLDYKQKSQQQPDQGSSWGEIYDAVIILGYGVNDDGSITHIAKARMDKALELYYQKKAERLIVSGCAANPKVRKTEAEVMQGYAQSQGVPESRIVTEPLARSTVGSAYYAKVNILEQKAWYKNIIVTSGFHLGRTRLIFDKILGDRYVTAYVGVKSPIEKRESIKRILRERLLCLHHELLFMGIKNGNHQNVRARFEYFHSPI